MKYMGNKGRILQEISESIYNLSADATTLCDHFVVLEL